MIAISDTSPILNLARIGRLELLPSLYGTIVIPQSVATELARYQHELPFQFSQNQFPWIQALRAGSRTRVDEFLVYLDPGEAEAIVLAIELGAELLLMDERRGRKLAGGAGIAVRGLLGVIVQAKDAGLIEFVRPVLDELRNHARFWITDALYREVLEEIGEI